MKVIGENESYIQTTCREHAEGLWENHNRFFACLADFCQFGHRADVWQTTWLDAGYLVFVAFGRA